jgi:serine acetyltransferase
VRWRAGQGLSHLTDDTPVGTRSVPVHKLKQIGPLRRSVLQDWPANVEGKSRFIVAWFRLAHLCRRGETPFPRVIEKVIDRSYRIVTMWFLSAELHPDVTAGPGLCIFHCHNVVLHPRTVLGERCVLRAGVCLGAKTLPDGTTGRAPRLGDGVDIGVGAVIIGDITIGDGCRIGAGAVVVKDVAAGVTVVGNPARPVAPARSK